MGEPHQSHRSHRNNWSITCNYQHNKEVHHHSTLTHFLNVSQLLSGYCWSRRGTSHSHRHRHDTFTVNVMREREARSHNLHWEIGQLRVEQVSVRIASWGELWVVTISQCTTARSRAPACTALSAGLYSLMLLHRPRSSDPTLRYGN